VITPVLIHHDFPGINMFVIAVVTLAAAALWPIQPLTAAAIVLALHPLNMFMEPVSKFLHGARGEYAWGGYDSSKVALWLVIFVSNALLVGGLCAWRRRSRQTPVAPLQTEVEPTRPVDAAPQSLRSYDRNLRKDKNLQSRSDPCQGLEDRRSTHNALDYRVNAVRTGCLR